MIVQNKEFNFIEVNDGEFLDTIKNRFVISLDFDGVITSPHRLKMEYINELGYNIKENQVDRDVCIASGVKEEDYNTGSIRAYTENPSKLPLEKYFFENFTKIRNFKKISIFIITSRYKNMMQHLQEYLKYYKIKVDGIINTGMENKILALKKIKADLFVEDSLSKLQDILNNLDKNSQEYLKGNFIFYRNISNSLIKNDGKIREVKNWNELYSIILEKYKELSP